MKTTETKLFFFFQPRNNHDKRTISNREITQHDEFVGFVFVSKEAKHEKLYSNKLIIKKVTSK